MKYKHALFLNPYVEKSATSFMGLFPPTGLEYVATSANDFVDKITLLDLRYNRELSNPEKLMDFIKKEIDVICVGIMWNRQFEEVCQLLNMMPDGIPLIVGGYKATEQVEELFQTCPKIDIIVRGEGEETIISLMKKEPLESILGISYRKDGKVIHNKNRPLPDVNLINPPDRSLRSNSYYMSLNGTKVTNLTFDTVLSARGCPFSCKFCTFSLNPLGQKRTFSARNAESVVDEIEEISANMVLFSDDNFFTDVKRSERICDLILERKIKKRFIAQARIDIAKYPKLLEKSVKAGFKMLLLGIESPHDWILEQFNKGFDQKTIRKRCKVLRRYPIYYHGYFIYGNIGETEKEMLYIPTFANEIGIDSITFHKLRIEKFSPLKEIAEQTPGYHVTTRGEIYSDRYSHATLKKIGRKIKFTFYTPVRLLKIAYKFVRIKIFTFSEISAFILASPFLLRNILAREIEKGRLKDSLKRLFVRNS
ncbi:MAG: B12-binding domain-containing radical SAM protein [Candidatus Omnitrophica bacterium]|nr:B12-binding domain-containing radical SAM protein [Candidatus Omnitrophota bacterium]